MVYEHHLEAAVADGFQRLSTIQGVGQRTALTLLAALPELGTLARGQASALAGLAPYNHDSGPHRGQRHIAHGRPLARGALYMAALVAAHSNRQLKEFYQRLRAAGKPAKVALTAVMRKLLIHDAHFSPQLHVFVGQYTAFAQRQNCASMTAFH